LLLTDEEVQGLIEIINRTDVDEEEKQGLMLEYLQGLIPDLDELLLEKASKLKKDLTWERLMSLEELYAGDQEKMGKLAEARHLAEEGQWRSAAVVLNAI
jgi:hypothetical protein